MSEYKPDDVIKSRLLGLMGVLILCFSGIGYATWMAITSSYLIAAITVFVVVLFILYYLTEMIRKVYFIAFNDGRKDNSDYVKRVAEVFARHVGEEIYGKRIKD